MASTHTFPGRAGGNDNPFGSFNPSQTASSGGIHALAEEEEGDTITSPTSPSFGVGKDSSPFGGPFGGDGTQGPPSSFHPPGGFPSNYGMGRRTSVSAESMNPTSSSNENWNAPYHQKTPEQLERLKTAIDKNILFNKLDDEQSAKVLGALVEKAIPAKDIKVR
jgi:cAMP-dependent protein kinase regulator